MAVPPLHWLGVRIWAREVFEIFGEGVIGRFKGSVEFIHEGALVGEEASARGGRAEDAGEEEALGRRSVTGA